MATKILCIGGPTASGKSARAVEEALARGGEVISVDSRQVYRGLDIGTEKTLPADMRGVPHHLIDIRDASDPYSAGDFARDAARLVEDIRARGKLPILAGGSHYYFDALLRGIPAVAPDPSFRAYADTLSDEELYALIREADPERALALDPKNRRRLVRALEIIRAHGAVPTRSQEAYEVEWILVDVPEEELRERIRTRLKSALERGLIDEVRRVREELATPASGGPPDAQSALRGDARLNELGLEYRIVGEYLRGERTEDTLLDALTAKLFQYARRQRAWMRKLEKKHPIQTNNQL